MLMNVQKKFTGRLQISGNIGCGKGVEMPNLSYSFHLSTKSHSVSTTGKVLQVSRHNLRQYKSDHYDQEMINILRGSETSILEDVKRIYHEEFDEALKRYNKGKRSDRVINDYLEHVSESRGDVACEIIIQIGDRDFWEDVRQRGWSMAKVREVMSPIFKSQLNELEKLVPELKIASAVEHYDESSPHMHVVGIPVATGYKKGLSKQVAKTKVFTSERLSFLQDKMREAADKDVRFCDSMIFVNDWMDDWHIDPDEKQPGRNRDIPKQSLDEYYRTKRETEKLKADIQEQKKQVQKLEAEKLNLEGAVSQKKADEKWIDRSIGFKQLEKNSLDTEKEFLKSEIVSLELNKKMLTLDIDDLRRERESLLSVKEDVKKLKEDKAALENDISCLKTEQDQWKQIEADAQAILDNINQERKKLEKERKETQEYKDQIDEYAEKHAERNDKLHEEIEQKKYVLQDLKMQEKEVKEQLDDLTEQVEEKLAIVEDELSPEFVRQMLNDSVTSNIVQATILKTCKQLGELGYLKVGATTAYLKINRESILESMKEHISDFIKDVKAHISKMLLKRSKTRHKSR